MNKLENYKVFYEIAVENYKELYDIYSNMIDKASKLLTFITIISGGVLFLLKWIFDNFNCLGQNKGWIIFITTILIGAMVIELGAILYAMYVKKMEKVRLKPEDNEFFIRNSIEAVYFRLAEIYTTANNRNFNTISSKSSWLGYTQIGLFVLIILIIFGIILIFKLI